MPATFRGRLTATMGALSIGVLALASVLIYVGLRWALVRNLDEAILALARTEISSAFDQPGGLVHTHDQAPSAVELGSVHATNFGVGMRFLFSRWLDLMPNSYTFIEASRRTSTNPALEGWRAFGGMLIQY